MNSTSGAQVVCPVCRNHDGGRCSQLSSGEVARFLCDVCGVFELSGTVYSTALDPEREVFSSIQRATLSHRIRVANLEGQKVHINSHWLKGFESDSGLPSPAIQATNIVRFVGDEIATSGKPLPRLPVSIAAISGSPNKEFAAKLASELCDRGILRAVDATSADGTELLNVDLTLDGWSQYEEERRGHVAGSYGFVAMKFGDVVLDSFVDEILKPGVKREIGAEVVDMRNVSRAGVIDNIMRAQIRDASFVLVDLTHDNSGAYWEAGFAEGLGKPVIYICEQKKFDSQNTHFDTNHCTTVCWTEEKPEEFLEELVATLRRSLNLFPKG